MPTLASRPLTTALAASAICPGRLAVRVAERHVLGARPGGRAQALERVTRVVGYRRKMLGVVDHPLSGIAQERDGVADHRQVLSGSPWSPSRVQAPGLPDQRHHRANPEASTLSASSSAASVSRRRVILKAAI
jgi:hypothetical protein